MLLLIIDACCFFFNLRNLNLTNPSYQDAMELMLSKEESDGNKIKSCTVHTQTDFGPYSAFPPQRDNNHPSAPSSPDNGEQQPPAVKGETQ